MPDLALGWTPHSRFRGIQGITVAPEGSQGVPALKRSSEQPLFSPYARPAEPQILVTCGAAVLGGYEWFRADAYESFMALPQ